MKYIHAKRSHHKGQKHQHQPQVQAQTQAPSPAQPVQAEFSFDTIHGMKLKEVEYRVPPMDERKRKRAEFQGSGHKEGVRSQFLKMLANEHAQELKDLLGMTDAEIARMAEGKSVNGYNVHHKLPIHGGGKNEFSNFILTPLYPHDQWHHDVLDQQIEGLGMGGARKVLLPWTDDMIFDPKKYGFTKDNEKVAPNYKSRVNPDNYPKIYLPEHVADAAARKRELDKIAPKEEKKQPDVAAIMKNRGRGR